MKQVFYAGVIVLFGIESLACSYDLRATQKAVMAEATEMVAVHMKARGFRSAMIEGQPHIETVESISTPMCPKELTHFIRLSVHAKRPTMGSPTNGAPCRGPLHLKVVVPFVGSNADSVHYTISGVQGLTCAQ